MKWFWGSIWTALLAALSGALVIANEDRIKETFASQNVVAHVYSSVWQPYPSKNETNTKVLMDRSPAGPFLIEQIEASKERHFAFIDVKNAGISDISGSRLQMGQREADILVVEGEGSARTFYDDVSEIELPTIRAGNDLKIYMWSPYDLGASYITGDIRIFTSDKQFLVKYHRDSSRYSEYTDEPAWLTFISEWLPFILFALLGLGLVGAMIVGAVWESYVKKMLNDDTFYLNEKIRYDSNPKMFQPDLKEIKKT